MQIENVEEIKTMCLYSIKGFLKEEKERIFQAVLNEEQPNAIIFVPCIGGHALPIEKDGLQEGLDSGEVFIMLVETP